MKYKVKNLSKEERKFRDGNGNDVVVEAGKTVITSNPPKKSDIWKVINTEKTEEKKIKKEVTSKKMEKHTMLDKA